MLHELLLSLSGHPSPLLSDKVIGPAAPEDDNGLRSLLSPAEVALLRTLAKDLGEPHRELRDHATAVSSSHSSSVCRAVAAAVISTHLSGFQKKIIEVERDILCGDPKLVGAYNAVPLSAIVSAFDGWGRKLRWLQNIVSCLRSPGVDSPTDACTAAQIIRKLRDETYSGFPDIEAMALDLVAKAEMAWLKQLSSWALYGVHPGGRDFFVTRDESKPGSSFEAFNLNESLIPCFVSVPTANSILFIGRSLWHIKQRQESAVDNAYRNVNLDFSLLSTHLAQLSALKAPISASSLTSAINAIRLSLSQNALQKLLPISNVLDLLQTLRDFFLLERGEFAVALIAAADDRLSQQAYGSNDKSRKPANITDLAHLTIRDGEVQNVLAKTWTALAMLDGDEEGSDDLIEQARDLISLSIRSIDAHDNGITTAGRAIISPTKFDDLLLPTSTVLSLQIVSPLDLFLTSTDMSLYTSMHSYLLAIRRAHLHLSQLYQLSNLRREHPPRSSSHPSRSHRAFDHPVESRHTANQFTKTQRPIWAAISSAAFFFAELGEYFHGEVIKSSWAAFQAWVTPPIDPAKQTSGSQSLSSSFRPGSSQVETRPDSSGLSNDVATYGIHDPESLAQAHRACISSLEQSILLHDTEFTRPLRRQMTVVDHVCGLMRRLDTVHGNLIAASEPGQQSRENIAMEERELITSLQATRLKLTDGIASLVARLHDIDDSRARGNDFQLGQKKSDAEFVPWKAGGLERLLLKFDSSGVENLVPSQFEHG